VDIGEEYAIRAPETRKSQGSAAALAPDGWLHGQANVCSRRARERLGLDLAPSGRPLVWQAVIRPRISQGSQP
jgi:hypothetical protein